MPTDDDERRASNERSRKSALAVLGTTAGLAMPGAAIVARLVEHVLDAWDQRRKAKADAFSLRLLHGLETPEEQEQIFQQLADVPEFADLVEVMLADFEAEKAEVYALAALRMAHGDIPGGARRDVVHALRELRMEDMVFLFEAFVAGGTGREPKKATDARHEGIVQRLLNTGCLEARKIGDVCIVSAFGKSLIDWVHSELPLPPPHAGQGRQRRGK